MAKAANFAANMHERSYRSWYEDKRVGSDSLINIDGRTAESLDGSWVFITDPYETSLRSKWHLEKRYDESGEELPVDYDFDRGERISVPSCWNMERPELFHFEGMGVYSRTFRYKPEREGERVFLEFEGASYRTYVFLNGVQVAMHDGASTPFSVEVTELLKLDNRLIVSVDASRSDSRVPMSNTDWFNYGGIYRSVNLVRLPKSFIKDHFIRLVPDGTFSKIQVSFEVDGVSKGEVGLEIPGLGVCKDIPFKEGKGDAIIEASPELWSPDNPKLYDYSLSTDGNAVSGRIGFREIRVDGYDIKLNGASIFLKGICVHEDHIKLGKCTNEDEIRRTIRTVKEDLGGNFIRLAHYPHSRLFSRLADEMGILLWEEVPVYWAIDFGNEETYKDAENQLCELVIRDRNRASVIIWSVGNENPDTDERLSFMTRLATKARELDGTRMISAACLVNEVELKIEDRLESVLDIVGLNEYYGWYKPDFNGLVRLLENSDPGKPLVITETGADARYGHHGTINTKWCEEYQAEVYRKQCATLSKCPYVRGMTPWLLYDFRAARRQNIWQEGFNRKGLIDADRIHRKLAFDVLADFYKSID